MTALTSMHNARTLNVKYITISIIIFKSTIFLKIVNSQYSHPNVRWGQNVNKIYLLTRWPILISQTPMIRFDQNWAPHPAVR